MEQLRKLLGQAFDAAYLEAQVVAREKAIALFIRAAASPDMPAPLRLFAITTLPVLGSHLGEVRLALGEHSGHHHG